MAEQRLRFNVWALALTGGVLWSFCVLSVGVCAQWLNWGVALRSVMSSLYIGFDRGVLGIVIGVVWAFPDAFVLLLLFGLLYNVFVGKSRSEA